MRMTNLQDTFIYFNLDLNKKGLIVDFKLFWRDEIELIHGKT